MKIMNFNLQLKSMKSFHFSEFIIREPYFSFIKYNFLFDLLIIYSIIRKICYYKPKEPTTNKTNIIYRILGWCSPLVN